MSKLKICAGAYIFILAVLLLSCSKTSDVTSPVPVHIVVNPVSLTLDVNSSATIAASVADDHKVIVGAPISYLSSNAQIVSVSSAGLVTAFAVPGSANITVQSGSATAIVPVTVIGPATNVVVTPESSTIPQRGTVQLAAKLVDASGATVSGPQIRYVPSDASIATASTSGLVTASGKAGTVGVAVTSGSLSHSVSITVTQVAGDLVLTPSPVTMYSGGTVTVSAALVDVAGQPMTAPTITWSSSTPSIVSVSSAGVLTAGATGGSATITAVGGGFTKTVVVTVTAVGHPLGVLDADLVSNPGAWGVAISAQGVALMPRQNDFSGIGRAILPATTIDVIASASQGVGAVFNAAGTIAYIANSTGNRIDVLDVASGNLTGSISIGASVFVCALSQDEHSLYVGDNTGQLFQMDIQSGSLIATIQIGTPVNSITRHPTLPLLYASATSGGRVVEINTVTNAVVRSFIVSGTAQESAISPDARTLWVLQEDGDLFAFDLLTGNKVGQYAGLGGFGMAITPDGAQLWITNSTNIFHIFDIATHTSRGVTVFGLPRRVAFSRDGSIALVTERSQGVAFFH